MFNCGVFRLTFTLQKRITQRGESCRTNLFGSGFLGRHRVSSPLPFLLVNPSQAKNHKWQLFCQLPCTQEAAAAKQHTQPTESFDSRPSQRKMHLPRQETRRIFLFSSTCHAWHLPWARSPFRATTQRALFFFEPHTKTKTLHEPIPSRSRESIPASNCGMSADWCKCSCGSPCGCDAEEHRAFRRSKNGCAGGAFFLIS